MSKSISRALLRSSSLIIFISSSVTLSSAAFANDPLQVVVTADRSEVPLKNTGSAITVITSEEIEKYGSKNIADVLRTVPGVTVAENGGLGSVAKVSLRGASGSKTLVLLDGVRISDPTNPEGFFDFGNLSSTNIERIEVLRGPQSALYGSDAMGGVINIISKKGKQTPVNEALIEGGAYGTISARGSTSGATDKVSYSFGFNTLHSDGFPRYGYRARPDGTRPLYPILPPEKQSLPVPTNDFTDKWGVSGNVSYRVDDTTSVETGMYYYSNALQFDSPNNTNPANIYNPVNNSHAEIVNGYIKAKFDSLDHKLKNQFTVFSNTTDRTNNQLYSFGFGRIDYTGTRVGAEYQGDIDLEHVGSLTFGARHETESMIIDYGFGPAPEYDQHTNSLFLQDRIALTDRLDVSLGGRLDRNNNGQSFLTGRSTFAYRVDELKSKLRGSIGTGAKIPSLFQRFGGSAAGELLPEKSFGYDLGIDQSLFDSNLNISATYFITDYRNLIGYASLNQSCDYYDSTDPLSGCYYNIGYVAARGFELTADAIIVPNQLNLKLSYTHNSSINKSDDPTDYGAGLQIYRTPKDQAMASLIYSGLAKFEFEPRVSWVGQRIDIYGYNVGSVKTVDNVTIPSYLKLDFLTRYKFNDSSTAYIRFENLTDAHTEDAFYYGSAGRSVYVGWTTRF